MENEIEGYYGPATSTFSSTLSQRINRQEEPRKFLIRMLLGIDECDTIVTKPESMKGPAGQMPRQKVIAMFPKTLRHQSGSTPHPSTR